MENKLFHISKLHVYMYYVRSHHEESLFEYKNQLRIEIIHDYINIPDQFDFKYKFKDEYQKRFHLDHHAFIAYAQDDPVHISWVALNKVWVDEIKSDLKFSPDTCCIYDVQTLPLFRGKGIFPDVLGFITRWWIARDGTRVIIYVRPTNTSSIRGIEKAGFCFSSEIKALIAFNKITLPRSITFEG